MLLVFLFEWSIGYEGLEGLCKKFWKECVGVMYVGKVSCGIVVSFLIGGVRWVGLVRGRWLWENIWWNFCVGY